MSDTNEMIGFTLNGASFGAEKTITVLAHSQKDALAAFAVITNGKKPNVSKFGTISVPIRQNHSSPSPTTKPTPPCN